MVPWHIDLPQKFLVGFTDSTQPNVLEFQVSNGPTKRRLRTTKAERFITTPCEMTGWQKSRFETFYSEDLNGGVDAFEWTNPYTKAKYNMRLRSNPKFTLKIPCLTEGNIAVLDEYTNPDTLYDCQLDLEWV